ncbi:MAG: hypothetical protein AABW81_00060 [Nanoarchaeota archaeon]
MKKAILNKSVALVLTVLIVGILILSGPADALKINMNLVKQTVKSIVLKTKVVVETSDNLDKIDYLTFVMNGPKTVRCEFYDTGRIKTPSACNGITIKKTSREKINYGYGSRPLNLEYSITINPKDFTKGTYSTSLEVLKGANTFSQPGPSVTIGNPVVRTINLNDLRVIRLN